VMIVASGYYFSELSGQVSSGTLTLKAVYDVGNASNQTAYINIMTHLISKRVLTLIGQGVTVTNAVAQAQQEFVDAFSDALPTSNLGQFSALSVYNTVGTNDAGNAYLLALSTGFYKYVATMAQQFGTTPDAELTLVLNKVSEDFAADGTLQTPGFISDFVKAIRSLSPTEITENLRRRSIIDYPSGLDVPNISRFLNQCAGAAECAWRSGAPMPLPSRGHATVEFAGKFYVFGGVTPADAPPGIFDPPPPTAYRHARVYDPVANNWTSLQPMPVGAYDLEAHAIGGKIYVVAGYGLNGFRNELMEYDPLTDTWSQKTPSPTYRYIFTSAVVNGRIYVIAGQGTIDDGPWVSGKPWAFKNHVAIYDPATDVWSEGQPTPMPFGEATSCTFDNKIYVFGGRTATGLEAFTLEYNTTSNSWSPKSPLPTAKEGADCVRVNDEFYVLGGRITGGAALDEVNRYNPATDTWTSPTRMPTGRYWFDADTVGGEIFIIGGMNGTPAVTLDLVEILNPML